MPNLLRRRLVHWIACAAILLNALAPTLAQALNAGGASDTLWLGSICSAQALDQAASAPADGPGGQPARGTGVCPYCGLQFWALAAAIDTSLDFSLRGSHVSTRHEPERQTKPLDPWPRAHARAPPSSTSFDGV